MERSAGFGTEVRICFTRFCPLCTIHVFAWFASHAASPCHTYGSESAVRTQCHIAKHFHATFTACAGGGQMDAVRDTGNVGHKGQPQRGDMLQVVVCCSHMHFGHDVLNGSAWLRSCSNPCQEVLDSVGLSGQIKPQDTAASLPARHTLTCHAHDARLSGGAREFEGTRLGERCGKKHTSRCKQVLAQTATN